MATRVPHIIVVSVEGKLCDTRRRRWVSLLLFLPGWLVLVGLVVVVALVMLMLLVLIVLLIVLPAHLLLW